MIKNVKMEVNNLTNREINYIIITGGITNLTGFSYLMDVEFNYEKIICNITPLGIRSNAYSSCFGSIKYFDNKMAFRDINYTMINKEEITNDEKSLDDLLDKLKDYSKK